MGRKIVRLLVRIHREILFVEIEEGGEGRQVRPLSIIFTATSIQWKHFNQLHK